MPELGAFGVVRTTGWKAWVIRAITKSAVNHAFIYIGAGQIVEANPSGAAIGSVGEYPIITWSRMPLTTQQQHAIVNAARSLVGTPYSWVDDACIGLADLFGWHVPEPVRKRLNRRDRLQCAQLVDRAYTMAGVHLFTDGRIEGSVAPSDLLDLIVAQQDSTIAH